MESAQAKLRSKRKPETSRTTGQANKAITKGLKRGTRTESKEGGSEYDCKTTAESLTERESANLSVLYPYGSDMEPLGKGCEQIAFRNEGRSVDSLSW